MQSKTDSDKNQADLTQRILFANPLNYQFFADPEKNKNARAYLDGYKVALNATGGDHSRALQLFQTSWNERHHGKNHTFDITLDDITQSLGNPAKATTKTQYYADKASHSEPLGRIFYKAVQGLSWFGSHLLPAAVYKKNVNISSDTKKSKTKGVFTNWIENTSDKKFRTSFKIFGKTRGLPVGSVLSIVGLVFSIAAFTIITVATFGGGVPFALGLAASALSASGAALGIVGGELATHHDRNKKDRDIAKLLKGTCDVAKQGLKENNAKIVKETNEIAKELIGQAIDRSVELHKNGLVIPRSAWITLGIKAAAGAAVPISDALVGTTGAMIKTASAFTVLSANTSNIVTQRYQHHLEAKASHNWKRVVAGNIMGLNEKLQQPLQGKSRDEHDIKSGNINDFDYKLVKWGKEYKKSAENIQPIESSGANIANTNYVDMLNKQNEIPTVGLSK